MPGTPFEEELAGRRLRFQRRHEAACVPRRFGIGTLLVVATAYAVLFGTLRGLRAPWQITIAVSIFLTIVGLVQFFAGPTYARRASMLLGSVSFAIPAFIMWLIGRPVAAEHFFTAMFAAMIGGGLFGYVAGVVVASVFLFINLANRWIHPRRSVPTDQTD
jgi:hypothetical protein